MHTDYGLWALGSASRQAKLSEVILSLRREGEHARFGLQG